MNGIVGTSFPFSAMDNRTEEEGKRYFAFFSGIDRFKTFAKMILFDSVNKLDT